METSSAELKRYVRFTAQDAARLAATKARVSPRFERIASEFYDRIREHEAAHAVLRSEEQIERLRRSLVGWLDRLFGGVYDDAYFARTAQIGKVHVNVGLPQRYMLSAMALIRSQLLAELDGSTAEDASTRDALCRLLDVELAIMLDAYREHWLARVESAAQRRSETALRRATPLEERAVTAIETAPLLVIAIDAAGEIVLFNRAAELLTGFAQDEILGRDFVSKLLPAEWREEGRAAIRRSGEDLELPLETRSGRQRMVRWSFVRANENDLAFAYGVDVTDDASARERAQQRRNLAALGNLTTGLAHELRNPLNGARLHATLLERMLAGGTPESLDAVRVVRSEIVRLTRLVDEFLEFAQPRPVVAGQLEAGALVRRVTAEEERVELDLPVTEIEMLADGGRLERALRCLVANAVEAGAQRVIVRVRREPSCVRFEVEDDGPGFDVGKPVFDPFYTTKADGTGLGLAIAHRAVLDHGGTIDVESRPGETRFRIRLPLRGEEEAQ